MIAERSLALASAMSARDMEKTHLRQHEDYRGGCDWCRKLWNFCMMNIEKLRWECEEMVEEQEEAEKEEVEKAESEEEGKESWVEGSWW